MKSSARSIRRRLKTVSSIGQLSRAMKTVAVSKYNRASACLAAMRPYRRQCRHLMETAGIPGVSPGPEAKAVCYVVLTANRGLSGSYNTEIWNLMESTLRAEKRPCSLVLAGRWGEARMGADKPGQLRRVFTISDIPTREEADSLARFLWDTWQEGQIQEISFISQRFHNILHQTPAIRQVLPIPSLPGRGEDTLFVPGQEQIVQDLIFRSLRADVHEIMLGAMAGAHGAMLMAMRTAMDNAQAMHAQLERTLNRLRQTAVTTEVLELSRAWGEEQEK